MDPDPHRGDGCEVPGAHLSEVVIALGVRAATEAGGGEKWPPLGSTARLLRSLGFCLLDSEVVPVDLGAQSLSRLLIQGQETVCCIL